MNEEDFRNLQTIIDLHMANPDTEIKTFTVLGEDGKETGDKVMAVVAPDGTKLEPMLTSDSAKLNYMYECIQPDGRGNLIIDGIEEDAENLQVIINLCVENPGSQIFTIDLNGEDGLPNGERAICVVDENEQILSPMFKSHPLKIDYLYQAIINDEDGNLVVAL